jgi:hypothetical protein
MKKMQICGLLVLLMICVVPVAAVVTPPTKSIGKPFDDIWTAIKDLQNQITNIPAGQQGPP